MAPVPKSRLWTGIIVLFAVLVLAGAVTTEAATEESPGGQPPEQQTQEIQNEEEPPASRTWALAIAIAVAIGVPCIGAGYAVGRVGAAALGAASEKPELLARSLLFVALAEGIAIYGLLIAVLLWIKI